MEVHPPFLVTSSIPPDGILCFLTTLVVLKQGTRAPGPGRQKAVFCLLSSAPPPLLGPRLFSGGGPGLGLRANGGIPPIFFSARVSVSESNSGLRLSVSSHRNALSAAFLPYRIVPAPRIGQSKEWGSEFQGDALKRTWAVSPRAPGGRVDHHPAAPNVHP